MFPKNFELKCILYQFIKQKKVPCDIVYHMYSIIQEEKKRIDNELRIFYKNIYLFNILDLYPFLSLRVCLLEYDLDEAKHDHEKTCPSLKIDIFQYRLPEKRNMEWAIEKYITKTNYILPDNIRDSQKSRLQMKNLLLDIKIIGEENYLISKKIIEGNDYDTLVPTTLPLKIKYLNKEPREEIQMDYLNYLEWKDTEDYLNWRIFVNEHGEGLYTT